MKGGEYMKKTIIGTGAVIASLFLAQGVFAQTATPTTTTTTSPTTTVTASPTPTGAMQGTTDVKVPSGAPATGRGGN